jgi:membrane associated rhomboid family serine protease
VEFSITLVIVIVTSLISVTGFAQQKIVDDLIFYPPAINQRHQYYRFITHGLIHADLIHLAFNMLALYSFGVAIEKVFSLDCIFGEKGKLFYLLLYFLGMIMASLPDYFKYRESYHFKSLGASGAVSAVIFSTIVFFPQNPIGLFFVPVQIPGFVFAILYLAISVYLDRRGGGRVNHSAHFWGAAFGIAFTLVFCQVFSNGFNVYDNFMQQFHSMNRVLPIQCDY